MKAGKKLDIAVAKEIFHIKVWAASKEEELKKKKNCFDYLLDSVLPPFSTSLDTAFLILEELQKEWITDIQDFRSPPTYHRWRVCCHQTDGTAVHMSGDSLPEVICNLGLAVIRKEWKKDKVTDAGRKRVKNGKK